MDILSHDVLSLIVDHLGCSDTYHLLLTNHSFNNDFGKDKFKKKFHFLLVKSLVNQNFNKFQKEISNINDSERDEIFIHTLHDIRTVWLNQEQGFYNMKYIFECMINGSRINDRSRLTNHNSTHFYEFFYQPIVDCIGSLNEEDRKEIQEKIDLSGILRSLNSDFKPVDKIVERI